jgi:hypothetical protein
MPVHFENRNDMIGVLFGFQIENQRRKSENTKCCRAKDPAFETRRRPIVQNFLWRSRREA